MFDIFRTLRLFTTSCLRVYDVEDLQKQQKQVVNIKHQIFFVF